MPKREYYRSTSRARKRQSLDGTAILVALTVLISVVSALAFEELQRVLLVALVVLICVLLVGLAALPLFRLFYEDTLRNRLRTETVESYDTLLTNGTPKWLAGKLFEYRLRVLFKVLGYKVTMTPVVGDQGTDLILTDHHGMRWSMQAKCWKNWYVGVGAIDEAIRGQAAYECSGSVVITQSKFTKEAREYAQKTGTVLIDRKQLDTLMSAARLILEGKASPKNRDYLVLAEEAQSGYF